MRNTVITLARRPEGMVNDSDFSIQEQPLSVLTDGQVRVEVHYISLDPAMRGWMNAGTTYIKGVEIGATMRAFAAGRVLESRHPDFAVNDYVTGLIGAQRFATVPGKYLTKVPANDQNLSKFLGVLGMPGMTAYFGMLDRGQPREGDSVFISGAAGIVGSTAGQIAKLKGCRVVGTAGTAAKCHFLTERCGFDAAINYKEEDVKTQLRAHCPEGLHVFYDNVGGPTLDHGLANLARGARVVICGAISQYNNRAMYGPTNYMKIVTARATMTGIIVFDFQERYPEAVQRISAWLASGQLVTKEDVVNGIERFSEALRMLYTGENFGKLLLRVQGN